METSSLRTLKIMPTNSNEKLYVHKFVFRTGTEKIPHKKAIVCKMLKYLENEKKSKSDGSEYKESNRNNYET